MDSPKLVILDVGHGNSAVLHDTNGIVIIDAGLRGTLDEYLQACHAQEVTALLISHSDADHLGGASNILASPDLRISAVYLNPDAAQKSTAYMAFRRALADSMRRNGTKVYTQLTSTTGKTISAGDVVIDVLAPGPALATAGNSGADLQGRKIRSNTMSAVIRISSTMEHVALLTGDIDQIALEHLIEENADLKATTLVFPHHGGLPGMGDPASFAASLVSAVKPELILFSTGRGARNVNPHPTVVSAILDTQPSAHIACTQLSTQCSAVVPPAGKHLSTLPSEGIATGKCCIGTVEIDVATPKNIFPVLQEHLAFVQQNAPSALCMQKKAQSP
jgi:beta-lactamase superfamily II metal-dependent hydrolase